MDAALDSDGEVRDGAQVAELTGLLDLRRGRPGCGSSCAARKPHPGAGLTLFEQADGWRYQAFATNTRGRPAGFLEARHRAHARVEDRIRVAKDTGLGRFPSREFTINQVWIQIAAIAADLTAWLQLIALDDDLAAKPKPKTLRFRMLHVPARLTRRRRDDDSSASPTTGPGPPRSPPRSRRITDHPRTHLNT